MLQNKNSFNFFSAATCAASPRASARNRKKKYVVFVLGGITLSEIRERELLGRQFGVPLYLGGSQILTPAKMVRFLESYPPEQLETLRANVNEKPRVPHTKGGGLTPLGLIKKQDKEFDSIGFKRTQKAY